MKHSTSLLTIFILIWSQDARGAANRYDILKARLEKINHFQFHLINFLGLNVSALFGSSNPSYLNGDYDIVSRVMPSTNPGCGNLCPSPYNTLTNMQLRSQTPTYRMDAKSKVSGGEKIVGGETVNPNSIPYQVHSR